jgi:hypothetical protein
MVSVKPGPVRRTRVRGYRVYYAGENSPLYYVYPIPKSTSKNHHAVTGRGDGVHGICTRYDSTSYIQAVNKPTCTAVTQL